MSTPVIDFLITLADPVTSRDYSDDPDGCMERHGLGPKQRQAMKEGNLYAIRRFAAEEVHSSSFHAAVIKRQCDEVDPEFRYSTALGAVELPVESNQEFEVKAARVSWCGAPGSAGPTVRRTKFPTRIVSGSWRVP